MDLVAKLWAYTESTWGGLPVLLVLNLVQLTLLSWTILEGGRAQREANARGIEPGLRRVRAARRAEIWRRKVRPLAMTLMLLGPGLGLGMSTLLGALGMGALGDAVGSQTNPELLAATMAKAYREISYAYFLMVGGTLPMLVGPLIVLAARRLEHAGTEARGGEPDELLLQAVSRLQSAAERDAAQTHALLGELAHALRQRAA